jgi:hypothetical protein
MVMLLRQQQQPHHDHHQCSNQTVVDNRDERRVGDQQPIEPHHNSAKMPVGTGGLPITQIQPPSNRADQDHRCWSVSHLDVVLGRGGLQQKKHPKFVFGFYHTPQPPTPANPLKEY